jgi:aldehyde dehydrogenase (NAD+)
MGNTVVLKPAEFTPLTALRFAELCVEAGLPDGVVNVVTGDGRTGAALVAHDDVDKIAFTGSTEVGRIIRTQIAGTGKKLSLELGGKSPFVVFDDADLDSVVEGVVDAIWFNQGQVCCAGSRILVQEGTAQRLTDKLRARMERLRVGDPLDKAVDIGAIIAPVQLERIDALVKQGVAEGATLWQPSWSCPQDGYFFPPSLFTDVAPAATIAQVEIFGPVVVMMTFRTHAEAVELANNTRYGLAASVWTESINLALDVAPKLKAGTVWINSTNVFDAASGFGGYRESGFGREGGKEGLYEYVRPSWEPKREPPPTAAPAESTAPAPARIDDGTPSIDRTAKLYIGGRQVRPDGGASLPVADRKGRLVAEVGLGNRKDVRNAVEAAHASAWAKQTAHNRAQVLYYLAENLAAREDEFAGRLRAFVKRDAVAAREVELSIERLFFYGRLRRQMGGPRAPDALPHGHARDARARRRAGRLLSGRRAAARVRLGGGARARARQHGRRGAERDRARSWPPTSTRSRTRPTAAGRAEHRDRPSRELLDPLAGHDDVEGLWYFPRTTDSAASSGSRRAT